jgi:hypothetical protein
MPGTELLVVAGHALWPVPAGPGGGRATGLVEALAARVTVRVLAPVNGSPTPGVAVALDALPEEEPVRRLVAVLSPQPRLGRALLGPRRSRALLQAVADHRPRAILFTDARLAAAAPAIDVPTFVDFPSLAVHAGGLEAFKARWWEPVEARRAVRASAATDDDVTRLASWGARALLVVDKSAAGPLVDTVEQVVRAPVPG